MAHTHVRLLVHAVFATKHRSPGLTPDIRGRLFAYIGGIVSNEGGALIAAGGVTDHLHLLIALPATKSLSDMMRDVKANSSRWLRETLPAMTGFAWQTGYGAFSVSESNVKAVCEYIEHQEAHHRGRTFEEEYTEFLKRHGIDDDPRWVLED